MLITDRLTGRVLGSLLVILPITIGISTYMLARPETRHAPHFALVVVLFTLPLCVLGLFVIRRAGRLEEEEE